MAKWVYKFEEGNASMRNLLGGKGCNLAEMTILGMPIPQGFTVTTEACTEYYNSGKQITQEIQDQIFEAITWLEELNGKKFGDTEDPLLVSVEINSKLAQPVEAINRVEQHFSREALGEALIVKFDFTSDIA